MGKRIFAIDPGLGGAWAYIEDGYALGCGDMPTTGTGTKRRVQGRILAQHIGGCVPHACVIEQVGAMPKQGVSSTFRFGMAYGSVIAVAQALDVPVELVAPQTWKRHFRLIGADKEASRQKALDLAPCLHESLSRKRDENRAEAILIGLYFASQLPDASEREAA